MTFSAESEDALLELIETGVSASADSLAAVSHTTWTTQTQSITKEGPGDIEGVRARLAGDTEEHYGAFLTMPGAVFLLTLPQKSAPSLAKAFMDGRTRDSGKTAPEGACIAEIANVVINSIANTMADACGDVFLLSAPTMLLGKKERFLKLAIDELKTAGETMAIMTYVSMSSEALSSDCTVLLLLSPACRGRILKALDD